MCMRESVHHVLTSACLHVSIWMCVCVPGLLGFVVFFFIQDQLWFTCVHLRQCGALWFPAPPPPPDSFLSPSSSRSSYYIPSLPFPTAALVSLYRHPSFVYSIEDVWLNILGPDESSRFSNFSCPACQRKTKACAKYIWMRSVNLFESTFYFSSFLVSITPHLPSPPLLFSPVCFCFFGPYLRICKGFVTKYGILFSVPASGQCQGPHIAVRECQPAMQQVQEPTGEHHALRDHTCVSAANQRGGGFRLYQCQLHRRIQVRKNMIWTLNFSVLCMAFTLLFNVQFQLIKVELIKWVQGCII